MFTDPYLERTKRNHFWVNGVDGQLKIKNLKVSVAGLGGMGSNIAEILVRLGVVNLKIADPDTIDLSNINRQVIANLNTVGKKKAEASANELKSLDSTLKLEVFPEGVNQENIKEFVQGADVIVNEIDVLHVDKHLCLLEEARQQNIPVYTVLVVGLGIHLYKFDPQSTFTPQDFLGALSENNNVDVLLETFGTPLPFYLQDKNLSEFKNEIRQEGVPIFGASTYLGQSLLAIRALLDQGCIKMHEEFPRTPCLPEFLMLDPLTLEFKTVSIKGKNASDC